jgi:hypothetical protein
VIARYRKAFAAAIGGLTPAAVVFLLALFGVHVDPTVASAICAVLATANTARAKPNAPKLPLIVQVPAGTTTTTGGTAP